MQEYDVVLSFAGEDRKHAKELADLLKMNGYSCFYDENELANLWGKNLYDYLSSVYKDQAHYCVMFLSKYYEQKLWTTHERQLAQARAFQENREYILPVRLDDTEIPGIPPTVGYLDLRLISIEEVYEALIKKLSSTASQKTSSDDNNVPNPESGKEKSFNYEHDQNVNTGDSKTPIGQEGVSKKRYHENANDKPLKGFITYSHENIEAKNELRKCLGVMEQNNELVTWDDGQLTPGDGALQEDILEKVADSDLLLYLVSAASLASKNCNKELAEALNQEIRIIPIILEHCDWLNHQLRGFEVLPEKGKPIYDISEWNPESKGWMSVVEGIRKVVNEMRSQAKPSPSVTPEEIETLAFLAFHRGNFMMMLDQIDEALKVYSRVIELSLNNAEVYNNRGCAFQMKGEYNRAIADYSKAIEISPDCPVFYNNRGAAYSAKGEYDRAIAEHNKAIEINPNHAKAYNNLATAYSAKGEYDRAIAACNTAIRISPDYTDPYVNRGVAYGYKGEYDHAIADCSKAIKIDPHYSSAYNTRGVAYSRKEMYERAIADFDKCIRLNPSNMIARKNRKDAFLLRRHAE